MSQFTRAHALQFLLDYDTLLASSQFPGLERQNRALWRTLLDAHRTYALIEEMREEQRQQEQLRRLGISDEKLALLERYLPFIESFEEAHALASPTVGSKPIAGVIADLWPSGLLLNTNTPWLESNNSHDLYLAAQLDEAMALAEVYWRRAPQRWSTKRIELHPRAEDVLHALNKFRAYSEDKRVPARRLAALVRRGESLIKTHAASLLKEGLICSMRGPKGGYWLTTFGRAKARNLKRKR